MREDDRLRDQLPADHLHGPAYLDFDEGVEAFVAELAELVPSGGRLALDEWTHAMARERSMLFAGDGPMDAGRVISKVKLCKTPDEVACLREALRITEVGVAEVQTRIAPGVKPDRPHRHLSPGDLRGRGRRQHPRPDVAGDARRASPTVHGPRPATSPCRCSPPSASSRSATSCGATPAPPSAASTPTSAGPGSSAVSPMPDSAPSSTAGWPSCAPSSTSPRRGRRAPTSPGGDRGQRRHQAVAAALLPRPRARHRQCRDALRRQRHR